MDPASRGWEWAVIAVAVPAHLLVGALAALLIAAGSQGVCNDPASATELHRARIEIAIVVGLALGPWLAAAVVAVRRRRPWLRFVLAAGAVASVPSLTLLAALAATPSDWTSGWCLF